MRVPAICLAVLMGSAFSAAHAESFLDARLKFGDDPRWAATTWDDRDWQQVDLSHLPTRAGVFWVRFRFARPDPATWKGEGDGWKWAPDGEGPPMDALATATTCSYDLYWDGHFLFSNGVVGSDRASEKPGEIEAMEQVPADMRGPGEHVLAFRISSYYCNFPRRSDFRLFFGMQNYDWRSAKEDSKALIPVTGMGAAIVMSAICATFFWFVDRRRPLFLCSLFSLVVAAYYLVVGSLSLSFMLDRPMTYDWLFPQLLASDCTMALSGFLMLWMFLEQYAVARRGWWLAALCALYAVAALESAGYAAAVLLLIRAALATSVMAAAWSVWKRRTGGAMALAATLIGLLVVHPENEEVKFLLGPTFLVTFGLVATSLLASVGLQVQAARQAARATQLTAARLEIELLKKNLQPHFLLNTLTALSEVVEQNPREAVSLIDDLAEEFRALSRMSGEKLIPISHELDLCRAHLRVMSLRTGRVWMLDTANVDEASLVPPALFLTLIENGFSHQRIAGAGGSFVLRQKAGPNASTTYVFVSPGVAHDEDVRSAGGTGIRYVKARLEESSPGRWTFRDRRTEAGWETVIEIRESAGAPCAS